MELNEVAFDDVRPIDGYGPGFFRVDGTAHHGAILALPQKVRDWGGYDDTAAILQVRELIDVIFVGTGAEIAHVPPAFRSRLEEAGLGVEVMASPAACRTYNVLLGEGRRVGAALLPVT